MLSWLNSFEQESLLQLKFLSEGISFEGINPDGIIFIFESLQIWIVLEFTIFALESLQIVLPSDVNPFRFESLYIWFPESFQIWIHLAPLPSYWNPFRLESFQIWIHASFLSPFTFESRQIWICKNLNIRLISSY